MDKPHPKATGEITEAAVIAELMKRHVPVSVPVGDNQRYDLIFEAKDRLWKAQVKTLYSPQGKRGVYMFNMKSTRINKNGYFANGYRGTVDVFLVWSIDLPLNLYIVPLDSVPNENAMFLRTEPARNNQKKVNRHEDFFFDTWLEKD